MDKTVIEAEYVTLWCYEGSRHELIPTIREIQRQGIPDNSDRTVKIVFFVANLPLKDYPSTYQSLKNSHGDIFLKHSVNILMISNKSEVPGLLAQLRKMNSPEFQGNYLKLQEISDRKIRESIIQDYISKKFKWNQVKINYFLQKNRVDTVQELLGYGGYPHWEQSLVVKTLDFIDYCQTQMNKKEKEEKPRICEEKK